jgi:hypothetical protein
MYLSESRASLCLGLLFFFFFSPCVPTFCLPRARQAKATEVTAQRKDERQRPFVAPKEQPRAVPAGPAVASIDVAALKTKLQRGLPAAKPVADGVGAFLLQGTAADDSAGDRQPGAKKKSKRHRADDHDEDADDAGAKKKKKKKSAKDDD